MKTAKLLFALILFCNLVSAQFPYTLKRFKSPDIRFQGLNLSTTLSGSNTSSLKQTSVNSRNSISLNASYFSFKNIDNYIGNQRIRGIFAGGFNKGKGEGFQGVATSNSMNGNLLLEGSSENRFYYANRYGSFLGIHSNVFQDTRYNTFNATNNGQEGDGKINDHTTNAQLYLTYGKGRVEPVRYARLAYDTYNLLYRKDRIATIPNQANIDSLATKMMEIANTRFFDSRFRTIFQLEQIDSVLRSSNTISETDMVYFAQLADVWLFANSFTRGNGSRWETGLNTVYSRSFQSSKRTFNDSVTEDIRAFESHTASAHIFVSYINQNPVSVVWQKDWGAAVYVGANGNLDTSFNAQNNAPITPTTGLNSFYTFGWFPNTRTALETEFYGALGLETSNFEESIFTGAYQTGVSLNFEYWISARFRLSVNALVVYGNSVQAVTFLQSEFDPLLNVPSGIYSSGSALGTNYNIRLSYALF